MKYDRNIYIPKKVNGFILRPRLCTFVGLIGQAISEIIMANEIWNNFLPRG